MDTGGVTIGNTEIKYGLTPVRKLLDAGYTVSDFAQIIDEPTLATCNLNQNGVAIAILSFYNIKEKLVISQLADIPVDLALLHKTQKPVKSKPVSRRQAFKNRVLWTVVIHFLAAAVFYCVYAGPGLFTWVQQTKFRAMGGSAPIGMVLLIMPALLVTFIWGGATLKQNKAVTKVLLSLWLILNVAISTAYLVIIDNAFTGRFF